LHAHNSPPEPFKLPPQVLEAFIECLSKKHVYIIHIDTHPAELKRKIFIVPVALNICVAILFFWRMSVAIPWYWTLVVTAFGHETEATFPSERAQWSTMGWEITRRGLSMFVDFALFLFLWPWPVNFLLGGSSGSPVGWRGRVGFRANEIYVRCSRDWDKTLTGDIFKDTDSMKILMGHVSQATEPLLQDQKTGYLLMGKYWDLHWDAMVRAHAMVDNKEIAIGAFRNVVLVHSEDYGWVSYDLKGSEAAGEDEKRRQVFLFRGALAAMGKEDLFYRWVETVQFEATRPDGWGPENQAAAAKKVRELFEAENINFDQVWKDAVSNTPE
jgi:hypothetical protein